MRHAVVIGAGMSGLLAAAALDRVAERVTVLDRDELPEGDAHRRGTAQSRHAHGLLARGLQVMEELLPGLTDELTARGAFGGDLQADCRWINEGRRLAPAPGDMPGLLVSRPLLEGQVRRRVSRLPGVEVTGGRQVADLVTAGDRVTGVRLVSGETITADLVVDASGRGSHTPAWLAGMGFPVPEQERVEIDLTYSTRLFRRLPGHLDGDPVVIMAATRAVPRAGVALAMEGDRWIVTIGGYGEAAPLDYEGFVSYAGSLPAPDIHELVSSAEPLDEGRRHRTPASVRRRYERLARFPRGLAVVGDAVCAFNPIYGQGMSVAAVEALRLGEWARRDRPARELFRSIARVVDAPWDIVVSGDLRLPGVRGRRTPGIRLVNAYLERFHRAAEHDAELGRRFLRVANLIDPPSALVRPACLLRVLRGVLAPAAGRGPVSLRTPQAGRPVP
ncbi:FAD-dependent oxidoreductase [Planobispora siamensis]|uniref:FAD-binding monooxygenase n=1 Tax=Planobispora siamensis TaxID=936338 RepID=A0A8J3SNE8_9ACTN|nr:FAD-dependent oxidoreductase [Planobispora siamensis]GIH95514.1 FAD-binding monooxygenase [Planobispora siamensis]